MKKIKTKLKDLYLFESKIFYDSRGNVREIYKKNNIGKQLTFSVVSKSKKNVIRGLHLQIKKPQDKFISVIKGKILDVVVDLRKNSKTFGKHYKIILSDKKPTFLFVPRGFAHGFLALEKENIVLYSCSNYRYSQYERSIKWNDKDLSIKWGIKNPILSKRDLKGLTLKEFIKNN
tara:strand:- start:289 stop:813 length:525 start_codon:yes stop_codon:yes gene_type:complete